MNFHKVFFRKTEQVNEFFFENLRTDAPPTVFKEFVQAHFAKFEQLRPFITFEKSQRFVHFKLVSCYDINIKLFLQK